MAAFRHTSIKPNTNGTIRGMNIVLSNLNKKIKEIEGATLGGLVKAGIAIRRDMETTSPTIPIDYGNLKASWFLVTAKSIKTNESPTFKGDKAENMAADHTSTVASAKGSIQGQLAVVMGFSANYALWVHEMVGANFKKAGSGAKFFESAIKRNKPLILQIIRDNAKIK